MLHFLHIIHSPTLKKFYVGETIGIQERIKIHNKHSFKNAFTKAADDWNLELAFECKNREDALYLKKFIKRMKSKKFILKVIEQPSILNDIISKK